MTVINCDCVLGMRMMLATGEVDSIVCDPPYELGFMGKGWDSTGIANSVEMWREAFRVLKPGGHLLAFSGTRTYHRMVCAIEDAGFEIRDQIGWLYGSGFPKSLDVSKAIDKAGGNPLAWRAFSEAYAAAVMDSAFSHADIDRSLGIKSSSCYWARTDHRGGMPPRQHWHVVCAMLGLPADFEHLYDEAEREIIGHQDRGLKPGSNRVFGEYSGDTRITAPATDAARRWQGWGTALKPAWEPIVVARKPLIGTVAANVLAHGTGAINVEACRVGDGGGTRLSVVTKKGDGIFEGGVNTGAFGVAVEGLGRWPANVIHDGSDEVLAAFPQAPGQLADASSSSRKTQNTYGAMQRGSGGAAAREELDKSAARFFYCAKTSKADRGEENTHPTVKPTALMRYLCRLVTPPGGLVLDPFTGSGSTGKAAVLEGFRFIGFEQSAEYVEIANSRIPRT